ncbi:tripartite tricarboxylate transporter substrate binding protein [Siccirubricoccus sp. KC 17139]|uniref:Tripartite tricarboxylate transporter substrate binding protein n=1 Tax=Siccirubricoccus soli TaxID=2899147 RepID=A0ABT1DC47_9PROT|nr:tripartite tricarboxylate transporter substrate-binding protein [Siccirubricoccus soli]MCO6419147.1 tripartite tricarboxylate transporter substrate binding protein [Siccirubricoccus soli]MCP2685282.1 tripartite tricarboxylate transporter substrate-binding protein [Siccirubricoccus soli]
MPARRTVLLAALAAPSLARAEGLAALFPTRPLRIIVPAVAAGGADTATRILLPRMAAELGQSIVADNRPGGSGNLANEILAQSPPDGHTLQMGTIGNLAVNPLIQRNLAVDPVRDFTHIGLSVQVTNLLVAPADRPWRKVEELVAAAKARPGTLAYGSSGVGSAGHLAGALLDQVAGTECIHVPYRGGGQLITDIISGKVDFAFATAATTLEHVETGRLRALAVPSAQRSALVPQVPTMAETGLPGYSVLNWYALVAPRGLPPAITARLNAALGAALADAEAQRKLAAQGIEPLPSTPEEATRFMTAEVAKWREVVAAARIGQG